MRLDLVRPDDAAWDRWLGGVPRDVYHTAGYHVFSQEMGEGDAYLVIVGDRRHGLAWPYLLRPVADVQGLAGSDARDVSSVYGYPGPVAWGCHPGDPFLQQAWRRIHALWREQGAVAAFTRFHPLLGNASLVAGLRLPSQPDDGPGPLVAEGATVSVDCTLADEDATRLYARALRQHIARAREAGLATTHDEEWEGLAAFARLYSETMARNRAASYYRFSEADFERLRSGLAGLLHLLVVRVNDTVAAAGLFTEFQGIVQAHLIASDEIYRPLSPAKLLLDDARRWARQRGNSTLHLGGGRGASEDSLLRFKSEFSPRRHVFHTGRWILDGSRYRELCAAHLARVSDPRALDQEFFPAYRAPVVG